MWNMTNIYICPKILAKSNECGEVITHGDYSENIQKKPKLEIQSMHFSKKPITLHCTVTHNSIDPKENIYAYHFTDILKHDFSDIMKHDWCHSKCVEVDIAENFLPEQSIIRKKPDNCSTQYKCRWTFGENREREMTSKKTIVCYYGSSGHGRGLVDGMSSWGVKNPLRKEIINNDFYMNSAEDMVDLFKGKQTESSQFDRMYYTEIKQDIYNSHTKPDALPINGSQKMHCIAFHPDGTVLTSRDICDCDECFAGNLNNCEYEGFEDDSDMDEADDEDDIEIDTDDEADSDDESDSEDDGYLNILDVVIPGQVVALMFTKASTCVLLLIQPRLNRKHSTHTNITFFLVRDIWCVSTLQRSRKQKRTFSTKNFLRMYLSFHVKSCALLLT